MSGQPASWPLIPDHAARAVDLCNLGEVDLSELIDFAQYLKDVERGLAPFFSDDQAVYYLEGLEPLHA